MRQLTAFVHAVERATERGTIHADLGYRILPPARQAAANLAPAGGDMAEQRAQ